MHVSNDAVHVQVQLYAHVGRSKATAVVLIAGQYPLAFGYDHITHSIADPFRTRNSKCVEPA